MSQLKQLTSPERKKFDNPPAFSREERNLFFHLNAKTRRVVSSLKKVENRVGFVLQHGYFKASGRFYASEKFKQRDINFVLKALAIPSSQFSLQRYLSSTQFEHRKRILKHLSWSDFNHAAKQKLTEHAKWHTGKQKRPKQVFLSLVDYCWKHQIEVPTYTELSDIVTRSYNEFEVDLLKNLNHCLQPYDKVYLDELIDAETKTHCPHPITLLKHVNQSHRPMDIARSLESMKVVEENFNRFLPVINQLDITDQANEYFSTWVKKATTRQLTRFSNRDKTYLYLMAYFKHQYFTRQDYMVDLFIKSVRTSFNKAIKRLNNRDIRTREERNKAIKALSKANKSARQLLNEIKLITKDNSATVNEKYYKIQDLLNEFEEAESNKDSALIESLEAQLDKVATNAFLYETLESLSRSLQLRVSNILKVLVFNPDTSDSTLIKVINHFKTTDGDIGQNAPTDFLKPSELKMVIKDDKLNISLYKHLLFGHVTDAIKSGDLNLKYSYRYRSIDDYLINKSDWIKFRNQYLKTSGLTKFKNVQKVLEKLKLDLNDKFDVVNQRVNDGLNPYLSFNSDGRPHIKTPKTPYDQSEFIANALSSGGFVPIQQLLVNVNRVCGFKDEFEHYSIKNSKLKLSIASVVAGLIGRGCNIGLEKMAHISNGVSKSTLDNTVNWSFELKNINAANRKIVKEIKELALSKSFIKEKNKIHSGSDGRKITVAVDSILASRSFKYFGKDAGTVMYTFIDERQALYYSTVLSASQREAPYVIDGLMNNDVNEDKIHSTDEFGFTESLFCATHLLGISFAPRFKRTGHKVLYGFSSRNTYKKKGYKILPSTNINQKLIIKHWDDILRFIATIKLNHNSASTLFTRLSSYAKQNPLYLALKEFGKIIKSKFILTYYDDVELRQQIQMQLGRIELSNKFSNAVFFDRDHEFQEGEIEQQKISTACMVLIQNAIVLWNYLFMSELIANTSDPELREELIASIKQGSMLSWRHVNLRGNYNFRNIAANDERFDMDKIRALVIN